jgi:hypothetical protein
VAVGKTDSRKVKRTAREANRETRAAAAARPFKVAVRWGYVVRGLLYGAMGVLAILLAFGRVGHASDQKGSLEYLVSNPFGRLLLGSFAIGLAAYSLWGFVRALYDPLNRGEDPIGIAARLSFVWSGIAYASLLVAVMQVLLGFDDTLARDSVQAIVAAALAKPAGQWATAVAGLIATAAGLAQFLDAWLTSFAHDLKRRSMSKREFLIAVQLGRLGMVSRGVIFTITGWFIFQAAMHRDPGRAHSFGKAFEALLQEPAGHILVTLVGLGFVALALHSFGYAGWVRMMPRASS